MSKSADDNPVQGRCVLYSGRPDPVWTVSPRDAASLTQIWSRLLPQAGPLARPPALGYRGCRISGAGGEWCAYGGVVTHSDAKRQEARRDAEREFERMVLASAPPDLLPMASLRKEFEKPSR